MTIWRLKTSPGTADGSNTADFCFQNGIAGFGWPVGEAPTNAAHYRTLAEEKYETEPQGRGADPDTQWSGNFDRLVDLMQIKDLIWIRNGQGVYFLGRVTSNWRYEGGTEYVRADTVNVRSVEWVSVGQADAVPGGVRNCFSVRGRTLQRINGDTVERISKKIFNDASGNQVYEVDLNGLNLWGLLGAEEIEDAVCMYLQVERGYRVWLSTKTRSTPRYECALVSTQDGHTAYFQAKGGGVPLAPADFQDLIVDGGNGVFLFASSGQYGANIPGVECLAPAAIEQFIRDNAHLMTQTVRRWL